MESQELREHLKCPVCFELPENEIFQCRNGHVVCGKCGESMYRCPQCRVNFPPLKVRVRVLEALVNSIKFDCPFKKSGCSEKIKRSSITQHSFSCIYNGKHIRFCELLGFKCDHFINSVDSSTAVLHFQAKHNLKCVVGRGASISLSNFNHLSKIKLEDSSEIIDTWNPIILNFNGNAITGPGPYFLILTLFDQYDDTMTWMCVHMGGGTAADYEVEFHIKEKSSELGDLKWKMRPMDILSCKDSLPLTAHRFDVDILQDNYMNTVKNALVVGVTISKYGRMALAMEDSKRKTLVDVTTVNPARQGSLTVALPTP